MLVELFILGLAIVVGFLAGVRWERKYWLDELDAVVNRISHSAQSGEGAVNVVEHTEDSGLG